jgi:hypothetical protein
MYVVEISRMKTYHFHDKVEADKFAEKWGVTAEYKSLCGDPECHCESLCKSFHYESANSFVPELNQSSHANNTRTNS